jgi:hypothetical protein
MKTLSRVVVGLFFVFSFCVAQAETNLTPAMIKAYNALPNQKLADLYSKFNTDPAFKKAGFQDGFEAVIACYIGADQKLKSTNEQPNEKGNLMQQELYIAFMDKKICSSRGDEMAATGVVSKNRVAELINKYNQMYASALKNIQADRGKSLGDLVQRGKQGAKLVNGIFSDYVASAVTNK